MYAILFIPVVYSLLVLIYSRNKDVNGLLEAVVKSHILLFAFITVSTEALSLFGWVDHSHLLGIWGIAFLSLIPGLMFTVQRGGRLPRIAPLHPEMKYFAPGVIAVGFFLSATLLAGLLYPPNTWDSMTYHMARVAHWVNNGNVLFYPTSIERQLYQMPLAEFAILHCQILSGSDVAANIVQWVCFAASICLVALIGRELGLGRVGQLLSSVAFTSMPMALLQASSTQNDLVVTSFVLSFVFFMLRMRSECSWENVVFASLGLGLALLTKGTAWVYCSVLGLLLALPILNAARPHLIMVVRRVGLLLVVVMIALAINGGHLLRTYQVYGKPIASGSQSYFNEDLSLPAVIGNIVRNVALHLGTPSHRVNSYLYRTLDVALGDQLNNPRNTWPGTSFGILFSRHEDTAGNPVHMLFAMFALGSAFIWMRHQRFSTNCYVVGVFLAGMLYCVLLKWQPWASRLHTPLFALVCPIIVIAVQRSFSSADKYVLVPSIILMVAFGAQFALHNESRSLLSLEWWSKPRAELYFANRPQLYESYRNVVDLLNTPGVGEVGLYLGEDDWEYPFWILGTNGHGFHHVGVNNQSRHAHSSAATPAYVIATRQVDGLQHSSEYHAAYSDDNLCLLIRSVGNSNSTSCLPFEKTSQYDQKADGAFSRLTFVLGRR